MTILNKYVETADEVVKNAASYLTTRDPKFLAEAIDLMQKQIAAFQTEMETPDLQEAILQVDLTTDEIGHRFARDNALAVDSSQFDVRGGPVVSGKLIRVISTDQEPETAFMMKVTFSDDSRVVLAPVVMPT